MSDVSNISATALAPLPGAVVRGGTAAAAMDVGDCVYMNSSGTWALADASAAASITGTLGIVVSGTKLDDDGDIASGEHIAVCIHGPVFLGPSVALSEESYVYPSDAVAGNITQTAPTIYRVFASCLSTNIIFVNPDPSGAAS